MHEDSECIVTALELFWWVAGMVIRGGGVGFYQPWVITLVGCSKCQCREEDSEGGCCVLLLSSAWRWWPRDTHTWRMSTALCVRHWEAGRMKSECWARSVSLSQISLSFYLLSCTSPYCLSSPSASRFPWWWCPACLAWVMCCTFRSLMLNALWGSFQRFR